MQETSSDIGPGGVNQHNQLAPALQQTLAQATLARQGLEQERRQMGARIVELETALERERELAAKAAAAAAAMASAPGSGSGRFEEFVRRKQKEGALVRLATICPRMGRSSESQSFRHPT